MEEITFIEVRDKGTGNLLTQVDIPRPRKLLVEEIRTAGRVFINENFYPVKGISLNPINGALIIETLDY